MHIYCSVGHSHLHWQYKPWGSYLGDPIRLIFFYWVSHLGKLVCVLTSTTSCVKYQRNTHKSQNILLFGLAKAGLKLSQSRSPNLLSTTTTHTNFWGTSRQPRKLIFNMQPNHNLRRNMKKRIRDNNPPSLQLQLNPAKHKLSRIVCETSLLFSTVCERFWIQKCLKNFWSRNEGLNSFSMK